VVKAGDVVKLRVKEVDVGRKRIALTMRSGAIDRTAPAGNGRPSAQASGPRSSAASPAPSAPAENAFAAALRRAQERR
jgi:uncharacterized protein